MGDFAPERATVMKNGMVAPTPTGFLYFYGGKVHIISHELDLHAAKKRIREAHHAYLTMWAKTFFKYYARKERNVNN